MRKNGVTSKDVAKLANVSQATVSYVLNNTSGKTISERTRKLVLKAAKDLNYTPNNAARVLKTNQANCIAIRLATNLALPRYHSVIQGIRSYLEPMGHNILLCSGKTRSGRFPDYINACINTQADGIIYVSSDYQDIPDEELDFIQSHNIPLVAIDCMKENLSVNSVIYDYFASSYVCTDYLIQKGFKKICYIRPEYDSAKEEAREKGVKAAVHSTEGVELRIEKLFTQDINSSELINTPLFSEPNKKLNTHIRNIITSAPNDVSFVSSFGNFKDVLANALLHKHLQDPKADKAPWHTRAANYHFVHYEAGLESARSLLDVFNENMPVRKITLKPILDIIDPELF